MGSEHYCLRWNNHQSNLLGVFSQLLQDESLVDVTLACSEGAPIRAHKVVLSACSSYFQSLFLDHPERHPIVILKDVRFAELQTLVEFMYKGEVNVQYCQLSALLKTAESLKVKGLAEMTNQNTTLREPEREPDRLRPHSQPSKSTCDSPVDAALAGPSTSTASSSSASAAAAAAAALSSTGSTSTNIAAAAAATGAAGAISATSAISAASTSSASSVSAAATAHKRDASDLRCSPTPPKRHQQQTSTSSERDSPVPLDLYQRRTTEPPLHEECSSDEQRATRTSETNIGAASSGSSTNANKQNCSNRSGSAAAAAAGVSLSGTSHSHSNNNGGGGGENEHDLLSSPERPASGSLHGVSTELGGVEKIEEPDDYDEEMDLDDEEGDNSSNEVGLNMKIGSSSMSLVGHHSAPATVVIPSPLSGLGSCTVGLCDPESARSTPAAATLSSSASGIPSDLTQRPASRSSRDGGGHIASIDRPSSSGALPASASSIVGGMSPSSSSTAAAVAAAAAAGVLSSEALAGPSGLGPVQSVPLSLKKEIDCSEDDNSNSRHHMQPRSASAGGGLGGDLDYRASHESETSESPHGGGGGGSGGGVGGSGSLGTAAGGSGGCIASATSASSSSAAAHEQQQSQQQQPQTPPHVYPCVYCGAVFPHQSKLTRHILSHSLKTLEYRETATHALMHSHLLPHDLNMTPLSQQFAYQMNAAAAAVDAQEQAAAVAAAAAAAMEMDFVSAMAAASGCGAAAALTNITSCGGRGLVDLDGGGDRDRGGSSDRGDRDDRGDRGRGGGGSSSGNGGIGCSSSGLILSGSGGSSTSAAAAAAASSSGSLLGSAGSSGGGGGGGVGDPNSIVLCKFCGKSFPDVATLITHLPVHTGDRPFKCEFCGKAFKLRHHMKDHCRVHTGERPFRCHMCGKTFSRSTILKAHEKTHFPKYVRKFLSPSPVDTKDELPQ